MIEVDYYCQSCGWKSPSSSTSMVCKCGGAIRGQMSIGVSKDSSIKDAKGESIWFPADERPYFDIALQKTFHSKKEKAQHMKEHDLVMDGSSTGKLPIEAGDNRFFKYK